MMLELTSAVRSGPELVVELPVRGGDVELILARGMVVDASELAVRYTRLAISRDRGRQHAADAVRPAGGPDESTARSAPGGWPLASDLSRGAATPPLPVPASATVPWLRPMARAQVIWAGPVAVMP